MATDLSTIDLRMLRALCAVGRENGFQAAADDLGYTQSAISQQVAALERAVGEKLVHRPGGRLTVSLTEAGQLIRVHAEAIFARLAAAEHELTLLHRGGRGVLRVGAYPTVASQLLAPVIAELRRTSPDLELVIEEHQDQRLLAQNVLYGSLDLAFAGAPSTEEALISHDLFNDPLVLVVRDGDPLTRLPSVGLLDLDGRCLAGPENCELQRVVIGGPGSSGIFPGLTLRSSSDEVLLRLASSGGTVSIMQSLSVQPPPDGLVALPLGHVLASTQIVLLAHRRRQLPAAAAGFMQAARQVGRELAARSCVSAAPVGRLRVAGH